MNRKEKLAELFGIIEFIIFRVFIVVCLLFGVGKLVSLDWKSLLQTFGL